MTLQSQTYQPSDRENYMNARQQVFFQQQLRSWRARLLQESRQSLQRIRTNEQDGGDLLDQSVKDSNKTMDFIARGRYEQTLRQIDAALQRLEDGSYGYCLETGDEIGLQRLLAYPIATLSVEAQEVREKLLRRHGTAIAC